MRLIKSAHKHSLGSTFGNFELSYMFLLFVHTFTKKTHFIFRIVNIKTQIFHLRIFMMREHIHNYEYINDRVVNFFEVDSHKFIIAFLYPRAIILLKTYTVALLFTPSRRNLPNRPVNLDK